MGLLGLEAQRGNPGELGAPKVCERQCLAGPTELDIEPVEVTSVMARMPLTG